MTSIEQASSQYIEPSVGSLRKGEVWWNDDKVFLPPELRIQVLKTFYDHQLVWNFGAHKTIELIQRSFWWPNLTQEDAPQEGALSGCYSE